jgi:hypothetical protein
VKEGGVKKGRGRPPGKFPKAVKVAKSPSSGTGRGRGRPAGSTKKVEAKVESSRSESRFFYPKLISPIFKIKPRFLVQYSSDDR